MKHIAIVTTGLVGITNASIQLVSKLKEEGFKVTYLCPFDIKKVIEGQGIDYIQLPEIDFNFSFLKTQSLIGRSFNLIKKHVFHYTNLMSQYEEGKKQLNFDVYETILRDLQPDVLLVDEELHEIILIGVKLKIQLKLISQFFPNQFRSNLPPISSNIIPNQGIRGSKLNILKTWSLIKLKIFGRIIIDNTTLKNNRRSLLKRYARDIGFAHKYLISRSFPSVFIHKHLPILSMTLLELDFPHATPKNITYIGAMVKGGKDLIITNELKVILDQKKPIDKKLIYCSVTTMAASGDVNFIQKVIDAIKDQENWELIISLGGKLSIHKFKVLPKNVHVFEWVPQQYILSKADCSINHGGIHTIHECISYKVPMLIYSGKRFDQNGNASRIAYHGLGLTGDKDLDDSKTINAKISKILTSSSIKENINKIHNTQKNYESKKLSSYL